MRRYRIETKHAFDRSFDKLPRDMQRRVAAKVDSLADNPRPRGWDDVQGGKDLCRVRVGDCRIVYQILDDLLLVLMVKVEKRSEVYRRR